MLRRSGWFSLIVVTLAGCSQAGRQEPSAVSEAPADLIVTNAIVWTGDGSRPGATAFAVRGGVFVCVGDDRAVERYAGPRTSRVDAAGARIIPGLIDAHLHLISGGHQLARLNLRDVPDRAAFIDAIAQRAKETPAGEWILGGRWSTESWPDPTPPTRGWIDPFTPDHPVLLSRMDGHSALANAVAMRLAGIDHQGPPDPTGGKIVRDPRTGAATGILKESAMDLVSDLVPDSSAASEDRALAAAMAEAHGHGLTTVHTMSPFSDLAPLGRARDAGTLTLRVRVYVSEDDWPAYLDRAGAFENDERLAVVGLKAFMDGSLGSRTAYMAEAYADNPPEDPGRRGLLTAAGAIDGEVVRLTRAADAAGLSVAVHAIGDEANHRVLDAYVEAMGEAGVRRGPRLRVEHAQHLLPEDVGRFGRLGVVASMQPLHKADDGRYAERALGPVRCRTSYAFRSLLEAGATVAFGSDWPVVTLDPFRGIHSAVTGRTLDGKTFVPEQNISVDAALRAYTVGGAAASGEEARLGRIKVGFLADFVIVDRDLLPVGSDDSSDVGSRAGALADVGVRATYVGGVRVWPTESSR